MFECLLIQHSICNPGDFLDQNCTFVANGHFIYEGSEKELKDNVSGVSIVASGICPSLGDLSREYLVQGCKEWFGVSI